MSRVDLGGPCPPKSTRTVQPSPGSVGVSSTKLPRGTQKPGAAQDAYPKSEQLPLRSQLPDQGLLWWQFAERAVGRNTSLRCRLEHGTFLLSQQG